MGQAPGRRKHFARGRARNVFDLRDEYWGFDDALAGHGWPLTGGEEPLRRAHAESRGEHASALAAGLPLFDRGPRIAYRVGLLTVGGALTVVALALVLGASAHESPSRSPSPANPKQEMHAGRPARGDDAPRGAPGPRQRLARLLKHAPVERKLLPAEPGRASAAPVSADKPAPAAHPPPAASRQAGGNEFSFER